MSYHPVYLGMQVRLAPAEASTAILEKFREAGANLRDTAERLGVTERTLHRYIGALKLEGKIEAVRERARKEGWLKSARWPEKKTKTEPKKKAKKKS